MTRKTHHIVPSKDKGWNVKKGGSTRSSAHATTKTEAIAIGRIISRNQKTELVIHNKNGKIADSDSHGHDPFPPRG